MKMNFLKSGDVIKIEDGMIVYTEIPSKFIHENRKLSDKLIGMNIVVDKKMTANTDITEEKSDIVSEIRHLFKSKLGCDISLDSVNYFIDSVVTNSTNMTEDFILKSGVFIVVKTKFDGGIDRFSNGHHVFCKRLKDGKYDVDGQEIDFYQSGSFTAMIKSSEIRPITTMIIPINIK